MPLAVGVEQALEIMVTNIKARIVTMIKGSPGTAKSALVDYLANQFNLCLIDFRMAQCDPTDLLGFPYIDPVTGRARYVPMETFPLEGDPLPINPATGVAYDGWLLFLDEFNSAERGVQKAAYKLVLDRMVGNKNLHANCAIIAAGNLDTDGAIVEEMSTALNSRIAHCYLTTDPKGWLTWAQGPGAIDWRITSFIEYSPKSLYTFDPDSVSLDPAYACYRTWEFANRQLCTGVDENTSGALQTFAGVLGEGVAREFLAYLRLGAKLPKIASIIADPTGTPLPQEPGVQFMLAGAIGQNADVTNIGPLMKYIARLPPEFQVITMREMLRRNIGLMQEKPVEQWTKDHGREFQA